MRLLPQVKEKWTEAPSKFSSFPASSAGRGPAKRFAPLHVCHPLGRSFLHGLEASQRSQSPASRIQAAADAIVVGVERERATRSASLKRKHGLGYGDAFAAELAVERGAGWLRPILNSQTWESCFRSTHSRGISKQL